ncbi:hypothetical protein CRENBAI_016369 [Crenichthys baileyi]|uniref:Uncharacterized protein n=1 Tax=Crenichthys baileyi TaxID=28760 RepID=A0AAV9R7Z6_9TELE
MFLSEISSVCSIPFIPTTLWTVTWKEQAPQIKIEYWWRFLHTECMEFWLSLFADIRDNGFFDGGFLDKSILQFCCMDSYRMSWMTLQEFGTHTSSGHPKTCKFPAVRPNVMYALPELYITRDFLCTSSK